MRLTRARTSSTSMCPMRLTRARAPFCERAAAHHPPKLVKLNPAVPVGVKGPEALCGQFHANGSDFAAAVRQEKRQLLLRDCAITVLVECVERPSASLWLLGQSGLVQGHG